MADSAGDEPNILEEFEREDAKGRRIHAIVVELVDRQNGR